MTDLQRRSGMVMRALSGMLPGGRRTYIASASEDQTAIVWCAAGSTPLWVSKAQVGYCNFFPVRLMVSR